MSIPSTKPYLLRAIYEWCVDQAFTPYVAVVVDGTTQVPRSYVRDGQIVLNIGPEAVQQLVMGNDSITCSARFGGVAQKLCLPVDNVAAIYARENGHGMAFDVMQTVDANAAVAEAEPVVEVDVPVAGSSEKKPTGAGSKPHLTRVK